MAILQISRVQVRRGLQEDLPQPLASGELGWSIDQRRLFIGNGSHEEGAAELGNTEILTSLSDVFGIENSYSFKGLRGGYEVQTGETAAADVYRTLQDKLDDNVNIRDFGSTVMGDGIYNCASAFNRAITQLYKDTALNGNPAVRRTIIVPAGAYKLSGDFIRLLPYVKLKGEGKNRTFIFQSDATQPCVISSVDVSVSGVSVVAPGKVELEGITFISNGAKDVAIFDATNDVVLTDVRLVDSTNDNIAAPIDSLDQSSCVRIQYSAATPSTAGFTTPPSNIKLFNSELSGKTYGVYSKNSASNVLVVACTLNKLYQGVAIGVANIDTPVSTEFKITHSIFDKIAAEGIIAGGPNGLAVPHVVSAFNTFLNVGNLQREPVTPGQEVTPFSAVIDFNGDNCFSFGDTFARSPASAIDAINLNNKASFATAPNGNVIMGVQRQHAGTDIELNDAVSSLTTASIVGVSDYPTIVEYTLLRSNTKRVGTMHITPVGTNVVFSDDFVETDDTGVTLVPSIANSVIELKYTSTFSQFKPVLKLASRTLVGALAPARMPDTLPDAPADLEVVPLSHNEVYAYLELYFLAPYNGGLPIIDYNLIVTKVFDYDTSTVTNEVVANLTTTSSPFTLPGLPRFNTYSFAVTARNALGSGPAGTLENYIYNP